MYCKCVNKITVAVVVVKFAVVFVVIARLNEIQKAHLMHLDCTCNRDNDTRIHFSRVSFSNNEYSFQWEP